MHRDAELVKQSFHSTRDLIHPALNIIDAKSHLYINHLIEDGWRLIRVGTDIHDHVVEQLFEIRIIEVFFCSGRDGVHRVHL